MSVRILQGDCRERLKDMPDALVHCVVTSPPYFGLRDYGVDGQIGLEPTPDAFVSEMVSVFREVRRVLRDDGTVWLNLGDSYSTHAAGRVANPMAKSTLAGVKTQEVGNESSRATGRYLKTPELPEKNLIGIPWRVAFALQADGWYLRQDIIWSKPNPMPESVTDRCTKAHEYLFLLSKSPRYFFDSAAVAEPAKPEHFGRYKYDFTGSKPGQEAAMPDGYTIHPKGARQPHETRNKRSVWEVTTQPFAGAHFATFPPALVEPCIKAGCPEGGVVLDPFAGAGTTGLVADRLGRNAVLIELNPEYASMAQARLSKDAGMFADITAEAAA